MDFPNLRFASSICAQRNRDLCLVSWCTKDQQFRQNEKLASLPICLVASSAKIKAAARAGFYPKGRVGATRRRGTISGYVRFSENGGTWGQLAEALADMKQRGGDERHRRAFRGSRTGGPLKAFDKPQIADAHLIESYAARCSVGLDP